MKNLKLAFIGLVLGCVSFAGVMASANSGHVAKPSFVSVLAEQTIVGELPARTIELPEVVIVGSLAPAKHASKAHTARVAQIRVTDLEQGGAPGALAVTRIN